MDFSGGAAKKVSPFSASFTLSPLRLESSAREESQCLAAFSTAYKFPYKWAFNKRSDKRHRGYWRGEGKYTGCQRREKRRRGDINNTISLIKDPKIDSWELRLYRLFTQFSSMEISSMFFKISLGKISANCQQMYSRKSHFAADKITEISCWWWLNCT